MKIINFFKNIAKYWSKPKEGNFLSNKETASYSLGGNGIQGLAAIFGYVAPISTSLILSTVYGIKPMDIWLIATLVALTGIIKTPIIGAIIDNTNTKWGKFKPLIVLFSIPTVVVLILFVTIPSRFTDYKQILTSIIILSILLSFFQPTTVALQNGLAQVMTTNGDERASLMSIYNIVANFLGSVIQIIIPAFAALVSPFPKDDAGNIIKDGLKHGIYDIKSYQILIPICAVLSLILILPELIWTKERIIKKENSKNQIGFFDGIKRAMTNKYFLIISLCMVLGSLRGLSSAFMMPWICSYSIGNEAGGAALGIAVTVCGFAFVPGMALTPLLAKKLGKRNLLIAVHICALIGILPMFLFLGTKPWEPWILLGFVFVQNLAAGPYIVTMIMNADILDYEQLKNGSRLEGFFNNFQMQFIALVSIGTTLVLPLILKNVCKLGLNTPIGENTYDVLKNATKRKEVFSWMLIIAAVANIVAIIPIFFYNLTDKKHKQIIKELEERVAKEDTV